MARVTSFWVTIARGTHPFPSRTRKLSLSAPMVLRAQVCGRVGSCPVYHKKPDREIGLLLLRAALPARFFERAAEEDRADSSNHEEAGVISSIQRMSVTSTPLLS